MRHWRRHLQAILAVTIPFFALILCGYLAAQRGVLPESAIPGLNGFVLFFALPCMLFRFGAGAPVAELLNPAVLGVYIACALMVVGLTLAVTLGARVDLRNASFGALVAAFPNTGLKLPGPVDSIVRMLGDSATPVALIKLLVHPLLVFALSTAARALGAPLSTFQITVLTLAERYGADNGRVARIILSSTVLAFVSFSGLAWVFGAVPK